MVKSAGIGSFLLCVWGFIGTVMDSFWIFSYFKRVMADSVQRILFTSGFIACYVGLGHFSFIVMREFLAGI